MTGPTARRRSRPCSRPAVRRRGVPYPAGRPRAAAGDGGAANTGIRGWAMRRRAARRSEMEEQAIQAETRRILTGPGEHHDVETVG
jgi:hypothetical protein